MLFTCRSVEIGKGVQAMSNFQREENRVIMRQGARELTPDELSTVVGAIQTKTKCTFDPVTQHVDGDTGEC